MIGSTSGYEELLNDFHRLQGLGEEFREEQDKRSSRFRDDEDALTRGLASRAQERQQQREENGRARQQMLRRAAALNLDLEGAAHPSGNRPDFAGVNAVLGAVEDAVQQRDALLLRDRRDRDARRQAEADAAAARRTRRAERMRFGSWGAALVIGLASLWLATVSQLGPLHLMTLFAIVAVSGTLRWLGGARARRGGRRHVILATAVALPLWWIQTKVLAILSSDPGTVPKGAESLWVSLVRLREAVAIGPLVASFTALFVLTAVGLGGRRRPDFACRAVSALAPGSMVAAAAGLLAWPLLLRRLQELSDAVTKAKLPESQQVVLLQDLVPQGSWAVGVSLLVGLWLGTVVARCVLPGQPAFPPHRP